MIRRAFGKTDLMVSALGLGCNDSRSGSRTSRAGEGLDQSQDSQSSCQVRCA